MAERKLERTAHEVQVLESLQPHACPGTRTLAPSHGVPAHCARLPSFNEDTVCGCTSVSSHVGRVNNSLDFYLKVFLFNCVLQIEFLILQRVDTLVVIAQNALYSICA